MVMIRPGLVVSFSWPLSTDYGAAAQESGGGGLAVVACSTHTHRRHSTHTHAHSTQRETKSRVSEARRICCWDEGSRSAGTPWQYGSTYRHASVSPVGWPGLASCRGRPLGAREAGASAAWFGPRWRRHRGVGGLDAELTGGPGRPGAAEAPGPCQGPESDPCTH